MVTERPQLLPEKIIKQQSNTFPNIDWNLLHHMVWYFFFCRKGNDEVLHNQTKHNLIDKIIDMSDILRRQIVILIPI
jgi:hypothetical protein